MLSLRPQSIGVPTADGQQIHGMSALGQVELPPRQGARHGGRRQRDDDAGSQRPVRTEQRPERQDAANDQDGGGDPLALGLGEAVGVDLPLAEVALQNLADGLGVPHTKE